MAEGEGFEPPVPLRAQRFSRPPVSTAHTSLRVRDQVVSPYYDADSYGLRSFASLRISPAGSDARKTAQVRIPLPPPWFSHRDSGPSTGPPRSPSGRKTGAVWGSPHTSVSSRIEMFLESSSLHATARVLRAPTFVGVAEASSAPDWPRNCAERAVGHVKISPAAPSAKH